MIKITVTWRTETMWEI